MIKSYLITIYNISTMEILDFPVMSDSSSLDIHVNECLRAAANTWNCDDSNLHVSISKNF